VMVCLARRVGYRVDNWYVDYTDELVFEGLVGGGESDPKWVFESLSKTTLVDYERYKRTGSFSR
jgi:hypothetical protein